MNEPPPLPESLPLDPEPPRPWALGATLGFSAIVVVAYLAVQVGVVVCYIATAAITNGGKTPGPEEIEALSMNGTVLSWATILSAVVCVPLILLFARLRKGISVSDYLHLYRPRIRDLVLWTILLFAIFIPIDLVYTEILDKPAVHPSMLEAYNSTEVIGLLWIALIIGAPFVEEFFFRGFFFAGFRNPLFAIPICAILWAIIHLQYDLAEIVIIFIGGIFLGIARYRTGNLWVPVILHFVWNLAATIEVAYATAATGP